MAMALREKDWMKLAYWVRDNEQLISNSPMFRVLEVASKRELNTRDREQGWTQLRMPKQAEIDKDTIETAISWANGYGFTKLEPTGE